MSAEQRKGAAELANHYARCFKIPIEEVRIEYREDDDCEVWAPGVGQVWTRGCVPYESTCLAAGFTRPPSDR